MLQHYLRERILFLQPTRMVLLSRATQSLLHPRPGSNSTHSCMITVTHLPPFASLESLVDAPLTALAVSTLSRHVARKDQSLIIAPLGIGDLLLPASGEELRKLRKTRHERIVGVSVFSSFPLHRRLRRDLHAALAELRRDKLRSLRARLVLVTCCCWRAASSCGNSF